MFLFSQTLTGMAGISRSNFYGMHIAMLEMRGYLWGWLGVKGSH